MDRARREPVHFLIRYDPRVDISTRGIPSHVCLNCGCSTFKILAAFDDYEIAWYTLNGYCAECDAPVTVPCPADRL